MTKNNLQFKIRKNREKRAIDLAQEILKASGLLKAPVDLFELIEQESPHLLVNSGDFKECFDGRLEYHATNNRFLLLFNNKYDSNPDDHHPRTRFSIAHELGHFYIEEHRNFLMLGGDAHSSASEFKTDDVIELEADAFAAGLLMPEQLIRPIVNQGVLTLERLTEVANHFKVSIVSAAIRSVSVSDFPCEVVGVRQGKVAWRFPSESLIEGKCYPISKGPIKSKNSRAQWDKFRTGQSLSESGSALPNEWFRSYGPAETAFTVYEEYLPVPAMETLVIILTIDERELFGEPE